MSGALVDVAIIGAGPYGMSLSSQLSAARIDHRIFGLPMQTWRDMPPGMFLKSFGFAVTLPSPYPERNLPSFCRAAGIEHFEPVPTAAFVRYGEEFQRDLVPHLEKTMVLRLLRDGEFVLELETGESVRARRVAIATGLNHLAYVPDFLAALPAGRVSHPSRPIDYARHADRDVVVVGRGQSAIEAAVLLHEHGARVRLVGRKPLEWSQRFDRDRSFLRRLMRPNSVVGASWVSYLLQHFPLLGYHIPERLRLWLTRTYLGPAGAWWVRDRFEHRVSFDDDVAALAATPDGDRLGMTITTASGARRRFAADHVVSGTGYRFELDRLPYMDPTLRGSLRRIAFAPALDRDCQSSVPGLYFMGPLGAATFGPMQRFVAGSRFATPTVFRHIEAALAAAAGVRVAGRTERATQ
jgi:cation diffusion facilitator CzcD-associated flavoprotein CzcO